MLDKDKAAWDAITRHYEAPQQPSGSTAPETARARRRAGCFERSRQRIRERPAAVRSLAVRRSGFSAARRECPGRGKHAAAIRPAGSAAPVRMRRAVPASRQQAWPVPPHRAPPLRPEARRRSPSRPKARPPAPAATQQAKRPQAALLRAIPRAARAPASLTRRLPAAPRLSRASPTPTAVKAAALKARRPRRAQAPRKVARPRRLLKAAQGRKEKHPAARVLRAKARPAGLHSRPASPAIPPSPGAPAARPSRSSNRGRKVARRRRAAPPGLPPRAQASRRGLLGSPRPRRAPHPAALRALRVQPARHRQAVRPRPRGVPAVSAPPAAAVDRRPRLRRAECHSPARQATCLGQSQWSPAPTAPASRPRERC